MKSLIHILISSALFASIALPQDKIFREVFSEKFTNERLKEIHNPNIDVLQRINDIDSLMLKSQNKTWQTALRNPQREFYEEEGFDVKDTWTTINKKQLGDGFLLIELFSQVWDSSAWVNYLKYSYTYDGNNILTEELYQTWDGSAWRNNSKTSYTYDGNNIRIEELRQYWNAAWLNIWHYSYTYDGNNNRTGALRQDWNNSSWVNSVKYTNTYNGNNSRTESLFQTWDGSAWVNNSKDSYTYDGNNNWTEELRQY